MQRSKATGSKPFSSLFKEILGPVNKTDQPQQQQQRSQPVEPPRTPSRSAMPSLLFACTPQKEGEQQESALQHRLMLARQKSMQFAPKIGSPLKNAAMYS